MKTNMPPLSLTGDDLALAESAASLAIAWWKSKEGKPSGFAKKEMAKFEALILKLSAIGSYAYPYDHYDSEAPEYGGESIMFLDPITTAQTRKTALAANQASQE